MAQTQTGKRSDRIRGSAPNAPNAPKSRKDRIDFGAQYTVFSIDERVELSREVLKDISNVEVQKFGGLMVDFAREKKASVVLRGLRAVSDFEYEFQLAGMNRKLMPEVDTIFMPTSERYTYISSSLVREIAVYGGDVSDFVDPKVCEALKSRFEKSTDKNS